MAQVVECLPSKHDAQGSNLINTNFFWLSVSMGVIKEVGILR
jgi:hypothetical protein